MNNLAATYDSMGSLEKAISLFEETLKLKSEKLGPHHPDTLMSVQNLGRTYLNANRLKKALPMFDRFVAGHRTRSIPDDPRFADLLESVSDDLLKHQQNSAAETYLRECLSIREKMLPDDWVHFYTKSMLGGVLTGQNKFDEAEPLLLEGYEGMKQRERNIPAITKVRLNDALQRLVDLYTDWNKPVKANEWRKKLDVAKAMLQKKKKKPRKIDDIKEKIDKPLVAPRPRSYRSKQKKFHPKPKTKKDNTKAQI